jgi:hypothetical protein
MWERYHWFRSWAFSEFTHVPSLSINLISIYQITHLVNCKRVEFTPNLVVITNFFDGTLVVVGKEYHQSMLYAFSNFIPKYPSIVLLTHCDEVNKL